MTTETNKIYKEVPILKFAEIKILVALLKEYYRASSDIVSRNHAKGLFSRLEELQMLGEVTDQ